MSKQLQYYLKQFPPSSVNNSRSIIKGMFERFERNPSELYAQELERLVNNLDVDHLDGDWGNGPIGEVNK